MPRITDELRRITREQSRAKGEGSTGGISAAEPSAEPAKRRAPWVVLIAVVVVAGLGWVVIDKLMAISKLQDCVLSGRKNCAPVEVVPPGK